MLIVLEGVDGSGKSTLAERLADLTGAELRHHSQLKRHPLEEYVLEYDDYVPGRSRSIVVDRLHLGEMIYGPLYRGGTKLTPVVRRYIDLYLRSRGAVVVHVTAALEEIQRRLGERGEDFLQAGHVEHVWRRYQELTGESYGVPLVNLRTDDADRYDAQVALVLSLAAAHEEQAALTWPATDGRHLGSPNPLVILVGDEPSPRHARGERPRYKAPFVPYADGSGRFLLEHLPETMLPGLAVVNQAEVNLEALWTACPEAAFVALGQVAHVALLQADLPHAVVPHPQRARRFHHARLPEYGRLIFDVAGTTRQEDKWPA